MTRCKGFNAQGQPCRKWAWKDGFCRAHHPTEGQDMSQLGRRGGSMRPETALRKAADDELREEARELLRKAMRGEEVPRPALDAAKSLFSYRAEQPPTEYEDKSEEERLTIEGRPAGNLWGVIKLLTLWHRQGNAPMTAEQKETALDLAAAAQEEPGTVPMYPTEGTDAENQAH